MVGCYVPVEELLLRHNLCAAFADTALTEVQVRGCARATRPTLLTDAPSRLRAQHGVYVSACVEDCFFVLHKALSRAMSTLSAPAAGALAHVTALALQDTVPAELRRAEGAAALDACRRLRTVRSFSHVAQPLARCPRCRRCWRPPRTLMLQRPRGARVGAALRGKAAGAARTAAARKRRRRRQRRGRGRGRRATNSRGC